MEDNKEDYEEFYIPGAIFSSDSLIIVDVRTEEEYMYGHIEESINIPLQELPYNYQQLSAYQDIVVICKSGIRSEYAKGFLKQAGFSKVYNGGGWDYFAALMEANRH